VTEDSNRLGETRVVRVLISREEESSWHAQALECDLLAIAASRAAALDTLVKVIEVQAAHDARHSRKPLARFAEAPQSCWRAYARTVSVVDPVELSRNTRASLHFLVANAVGRSEPA
jgi:hypothetical protein